METKYNAQAIRDAAAKLDSILDDMSAFTGAGMIEIWPDAGKFDLAVWLEMIVGDRRDAIEAHANHLHATFENMAVQLKTIADTFPNTDGENAKKIKDLLDGLRTQIEGQWRTWDENTEKRYQNYSVGPGNNNRAGDGDGYNNNLNSRDF